MNNLKKLAAKKSELIRLKKATLKKCDHVISDAIAKTIAAKSNFQDKDTDDVLYRTIVGNTYNFMDSHDDVHIKGIFTKSIKENGSQILHLHDHIHQLDAQVGKSLKVYEKAVKLSDVGMNKNGETTALLMDSRIERKRNETIFEDYRDKLINQHSVGMQYVKIELAINDPEEKEEFAVWNKYIGSIVNKELAEEKGFFWAVLEAKLIEISCVIKGSNELTPTLEPKNYDIDGLAELSEKVEQEPTKENILHLCKEVKALQAGEAVLKTLPKAEKPQENSFYKNLLKN